MYIFLFLFLFKIIPFLLLLSFFHHQHHYTSILLIVYKCIHVNAGTICIYYIYIKKHKSTAVGATNHKKKHVH